MPVSPVPALRRRVLVDAEPSPEGDYVLYWMIATRRVAWNFSLDRAIELATRLGRPLLVFEPIRAAYRWASDRHHQAIIDGMAHHRAELAGTAVGYYPYVEPEDGAGRGLLEALARRACAVVTDDAPTFFTPSLLEAVARRLRHLRVEAIDSCGLLPLRATDRGYAAAYHFRRFLHKTLPAHLGSMPAADPLACVDLRALSGIPQDVATRWPPAYELLPDNGFWGTDPAAGEEGERSGHATLDLGSLPIDHSVAPTGWRGGRAAARSRLAAFLDNGLGRYAGERNDPDAEVSSRLSAWLHYGHLSSHEVFHAVARREAWTPARITGPDDGRRAGWWGMKAGAEAFIDQLITWRELGYGFCYHEPDYARYETLPAWARATLDQHASDDRKHVYTLRELDAAETHDVVWNAAQRELVHAGTIHNYLRMLWGKRIVAWTEHPRDALDFMTELNNRYALDGRDPNSSSGIMWILGRFDRGWPEREIYGKVRTMTTRSTRRKVALDGYLRRWGDEGSAW